MVLAMVLLLQPIVLGPYRCNGIVIKTLLLVYRIVAEYSMYIVYTLGIELVPNQQQL